MATVFDNNQNNQQQNNQQQQAGTQPISTGATAPSAQNPAQKQPQGSGRFTNLQKYIGANQGAGEKLGQNISNTINKDIGEKKDQTQNYYTQLGDSVNQAKQAAQQGVGYVNQLKGIGQNIKNDAGELANRGQDFGVSEFRNSPGFQNFQNVQSGKAINEQLLGLRNQQAQQAAQEYAQSANQAVSNLGSEQGRFNLLKQSMGQNPNYSLGQQRLDSLFLSKGGLNNLRQQVNQESQNASNLLKQNQIANADIKSLTGQEQNIINDINSQATQNAQEYQNLLGKYIPQVNAQRDINWQNLQDSLNSKNLTADQARALGLNPDQGPIRTYNVLNNLSASDIAQKNPDITNVNDVVNTSELSRYNALADIAGINANNRNIKANANNIINDNGGSLGFSGLSGEANLQNRLQTAAQNFNNLAQNTNLSQTYRDQLQDYYMPTAATNPMYGSQTGRLATWDENPFSFGGTASGNAADLLTRGQQGINSSRVGNYQESDWGKGEQQNAANDVWNQFNNWLNSQGYNNQMSFAGNKAGKKGYTPGK